MYNKVKHDTVKWQRFKRGSGKRDWERKNFRYLDDRTTKENTMFDYIRREAMWSQDRWGKHTLEETHCSSSQRNSATLTQSLLVVVYIVTANQRGVGYPKLMLAN